MKKIITALILGSFLLPSRADELQRLLESVEAHNLGLKSMREQIVATREELKSVNTLDNTSVEYSPFFRKGAAGVASSELIVSQELDFPTLYAARSKSGKRQVEVAERRYQLDGRDLLLQTAETYMELVRLNRIKAALTHQLETAVNLTALMAKREATGDVTSIELNRIKIQQMEIESSLIANGAERESVIAAIEAFNGYEPFACEGDEYPVWLVSPSDNTTSGDAEMLVAGAEVESMRQEESVAKQGWVPKLTLGYRRNTELDEASNGFVVGAAFPLFGTSSKVKAAKAKRLVAEIELENTRKRVENEIMTAFKEAEALQKSMKVYDLRLLDESERLLNRAVELGNMTMSDYYAELAALNEKRMAYIDLEYEYYRRLCVLNKNRLNNNGK